MYICFIVGFNVCVCMCVDKDNCACLLSELQHHTSYGDHMEPEQLGMLVCVGVVVCFS